MGVREEKNSPQRKQRPAEDAEKKGKIEDSKRAAGRSEDRPAQFLAPVFMAMATPRASAISCLEAPALRAASVWKVMRHSGW
jgi:hypothetical protein